VKTRSVLVAVILAVVSSALLGCARGPYEAKIVEVYQEDIDANDGQVQRAWYTTLDLQDRGRVILYGKYGETGDVVKVFYFPGEGWRANR
jgi:hypothetical protein